MKNASPLLRNLFEKKKKYVCFVKYVFISFIKVELLSTLADLADRIFMNYFKPLQKLLSYKIISMHTSRARLIQCFGFHEKRVILRSNKYNKNI